MRVLAALAVLALAALSACARDPLAVRAFKDACERTGYDCRDVPVPRISRSHVMPKEWMGVYWGTDTVYVNATREETTEMYAVLVHEMVHYLQVKVGGALVLSTHPAYACAIEEEAFAVSNAILWEAGLTPRFDWHLSYGCKFDEV